MGGKWGGRTLRNVDYAASQWEVQEVRLLLKEAGMYLQKFISWTTSTRGANDPRNEQKLHQLFNPVDY